MYCCVTGEVRLMSTVVLQVKLDVYKVSDIPVRHQVWSGWPEKTSDDAVSCFFFYYYYLFQNSSGFVHTVILNCFKQIKQIINAIFTHSIGTPWVQAPPCPAIFFHGD